MKPGDLIEWAYKSDGKVVHPHEELWSSIEKRYVPIGGLHLFVSNVDGTLTWLPLGENCKGLLHAREADTVGVPRRRRLYPRLYHT